MGDTDTPSTLPPALLAKLKKRGIVKSEPALVPEPDLPPNWRVVVEKGTDSKYYWNTVTGATVWDRPTHPNDDPTAGPSDTEAPSSDGPQPPASNVSSSAAAAAAAAAEGGSVIGPTLMKRAYEALVLNEIPDDVEEGEPPAQVPPTTAALPHVDVLSGPQDFGPAVSTVAADAPIRYETRWIQVRTATLRLGSGGTGWIKRPTPGCSRWARSNLHGESLLVIPFVVVNSRRAIFANRTASIRSS
eukprot:m.272794 g.272794  ORF g.272794 m.272794 type:complete len:245 (+) comp16112_c0_seq2:356-1090(+)